MLCRVQLLEEVSESPRVGRKSTPGREHGARPSGLGISGQDICAADNERPIWRSRLLARPTADHITYPTQFWHPDRLSSPGRRVAAFASIGSNGVPGCGALSPVPERRVGRLRWRARRCACRASQAGLGGPLGGVGGELERRRVSPVPPATVGVRASRAAHGTGDRVCNSKSPECLLSRGVSVFTPRRSLTQRRDGAPKSASDPLSSQLWLPSWRARSCGFRDPGGPRCSRKGPRDRSADASGSAGFFCQQPVPARASAKAAMPAPVLGSADSCSSGCRRACLQTGDALATARLATPPPPS